MALARTHRLRRRGSRIAPLCLLTLSALALPACYATKADVRRLQNNLVDVQARQDSLVRATARQSRALQDSLRASTELMRMLRGQVSNDIGDVKELLLTVQQLLGQNEQRLAQLREQFEQRQQQAAAQTVTQPVATSSGNVDELYAAGMGRLKESPATARLLFQQIVSDFPRSERAPDAQYYIGETYYEERNFEQAYREYELVVSSYPDHRRAPGALLRAGVIAEERNDRDKARQYYTRLANSYKNSDEAGEATRALQRLRR